MNYLKYAAILLLGFGFFTSCNDDDDDEVCCDPSNPECSNYDPCFGKYPNAQFKMRQTTPGFVIPEERQAEWCDTILGSGVEFLADMKDGLSYTWQIGSESQVRSGNRLTISFSEYTEDTLQNLNSEHPNFFNLLPITLTVRNALGTCVTASDTVLTMTKHLVLARQSLTKGTFRGRLEGENFDRDVTLWKDSLNLSNPNPQFWYISFIFGFPLKDTIAYYDVWSGSMQSQARSYKQRRWNEDVAPVWWIGTDGIHNYNQQITTSSTGSDKVDLYFERYPEDNSGLQIVKFSGYRLE